MPADAAPATTPRLILCVEDDMVMQGVYRAILSQRGYQVAVHGSALSALAALANCRPQMLIIDLGLPDMSGLDLVRQLQADPAVSGIPFMIVSSREEEETIAASLELGAIDYLVKPFRPAELLAKVGTCISRRALGRIRQHHATQLFDGRYELLQKLGSGGSSTVYRARDQNHPEWGEVALKIYDLGFMQVYRVEDMLSRFLREAYQLSKLHHPHIVELRDFGRITSGQFYLVMEFVAGETLQDILIHHGTLAEGETVFIGYRMAEILEYLQGQNLQHRDINPRNIMIAGDGDLKVIDFGLARTLRDTLAVEGDLIMGTPLFIAPELLVAGHEPTIASDVYSLGVTLYLCLCRYVPFRGSPQEVIAQQSQHGLPPLALAMPELSSGFTRLIDAMLSPLPNERPSPAELTLAFADLLNDDELVAEPS